MESLLYRFSRQLSSPFRTATRDSAVWAARRLHDIKKVFHCGLQFLERHIAAVFNQRLHPAVGLSD